MKKSSGALPVQINKVTTILADDIRYIIDEAKAGLAATVNSALTSLYWRVGQRIHSEVLKGERAEYGAQIVNTLAKQLEADQGRGFSAKNLRHMMRFAEVFPDSQIVSTLSRQLAWSHFLEIIYIKDDLKRNFYAEMCRLEKWSVRDLRQRTGSLLFERTALSKKPGWAGSDATVEAS